MTSEAPLSERAAHAAFQSCNDTTPTAAPYLEGLNDAQRAAVTTIQGPVLVLAGAGTGKTRALTTRLAHLLATSNARPWEILAVTFTNKAAREMRARTGALIGDAVEGMQWLGTFHSIAAKVLRLHAEIVALKPSFTIIDTDDQVRLCKQLITAANLDEKRFPGRNLAIVIDRWKNRGLTPDTVPANEAHHFADGQAIDLYRAYQRHLVTLNAADFGDLLLHCLRIFQHHPDILTKYHNKFKYILVDEYQDTNIAQYLWLRLLAQAHKNICCVGDDDQSIYGWRGAEVGNILKFEKDFPSAAIIRLERNYRSTPAILAAASGLIAANKTRLGKTLWTDRKDTQKVCLRGVWDGEEEARNVCDTIEVAQTKGYNLSDMAVLVRASFQMRAFEERFNVLGLPYQVVGGPRFYEREEMRDALAYLRLIRNQDDDLSFTRIINKPRRGFGEQSIRALHSVARADHVSMVAAGQHLLTSNALKGKARTSLTQFLEALTRWQAMALTTAPPALAEIVLKESGYTEFWKNSKSPQAPSKLENLKEFIQAISEFDTLETYLEHVSLVADTPTNTTSGQVWLMTLHAAKGLEFPLVFLPGWEEGIFPSQRSLDEKGIVGLEEERRLAYVGLTRAKECAHISFAANRQIYGRWQNALPSRFIDELPEAHVDVESAPGLYQPPTATRTASDVKARSFQEGERVFHRSFGYGKVLSQDSSRLEILFDDAGSKTIMDSFVTSAKK